MKYYSDKTEKVYETVEELETAEKELAEKVAAEKKAKEEAEAKRATAIAEAKAKREALAKERGERAKAVEDAMKAYNEHRAEKAKELEAERAEVAKLVDKFVSDYGYFHTSFKSSSEMPSFAFTTFSKPFSSIFDDFFKNF